MEWLKDKKNLPIVVALAVFFVLAAGGLIAFELGAFNGSSSAAPTPIASGTPPPTPGGAPMPMRVGPMPPRGMPGMPSGVRGMPTAPGPAAANPAAKLPAKSDAVNPAVGPDPFYIPGGQRKIASEQAAAAGPKLSVRDRIGPLDLFQIHVPEPPAPPIIPTDNSGGISPGTQTNAAPLPRFSGVITGENGINAILESGGQSQTVKPGDTLPDGSQVQSIQTTSVTLRTAGGAVVSLPLSAGTPDQGTTSPNGQPQFNQYGQPPFNQ